MDLSAFPPNPGKILASAPPGSEEVLQCGRSGETGATQRNKGLDVSGIKSHEELPRLPCQHLSNHFPLPKSAQKSPNPGESCGFPSPCEDFGREPSPHFLTSPSFSFPWQCKKKHTLVCPDFAKKGVCPQGARCKLLHPRKKRQPRGDGADPPSKCQRLCEETGR